MNKMVRIAVAIALFCFGGWLIWLFIINVQSSDSNIKAGLIGLFGMLTAALITHYQTKKREINARHFGDKRTGYMHMIDLLFDLIIAVKKGEELSEDKLLDKIMPFKKALIVWGSPQVIDAWNHFELESESGLAPEQMLREMESILRAIRKDLGHDDSTLKFGSLWALMLVAKDKKMALGGKKGGVVQ